MKILYFKKLRLIYINIWEYMNYRVTLVWETCPLYTWILSWISLTQWLSMKSLTIVLNQRQPYWSLLNLTENCTQKLYRGSSSIITVGNIYIYFIYTFKCILFIQMHWNQSEIVIEKFWPRSILIYRITLILNNVSIINEINVRGFLFLWKLPLADKDKILKPI